ncbi:MAG: ABC transporter ATP-binding protein [Candidatus Heimdallarchaeota archaeon]|nr:ABC transporter ATP-binding protein [Candidatus Heimdallarchaeota archaeon]
MTTDHIGKYRDLAEDAERGIQPRITSDIVLGKWIFGYLKDFKSSVIIALILVISSSVIGLASPYLSGLILDKGLGENPSEDGNFELLLIFCLILLAIAIFNAVIDVFKNITLNKIGQKSVRKIRKDTFTKVQSLSMKYFDTQNTGQIISRVTNDCNKVNELMSGSLINSVTDFLTVIGVAVFLIVMNWELGLITLAISIPSIIVISYIFNLRARKAYRKTRKTIANVTASLSESIDGVKVSKSFTREKMNIKEFKEINLEDRKANLQVEAIFSITYPIYNFISQVVVGVVYLYTGWTLYKAGASIHVPITIGEAVAFTGYIGMLFSPILNLSMFFNVYQSTMAATERIYELNQTQSDVIEKEKAIEIPKIKGAIKFEDVIFSYGGDKLVLDKFNLEVKPGETIAIVGPTGAGKTTIINVLARFYEIQKGSITIDGYNIQDVTLNSLHKQMGIVLQDPYLFSGTIKENISYGNPEISDHRIISAAKVVNAYEFIKHTPKGFDTDVGEDGRRLSIGQRQLISFARAIINNPRILILDEATSSVDPYTEVLIKNALEKILKDRTSFIVAHRLSTVRKANRIIVIKNGTIIEEGTNEELLSLKGEYYKLYQLQFKDQEEVK